MLHREASYYTTNQKGSTGAVAWKEQWSTNPLPRLPTSESTRRRGVRSKGNELGCLMFAGVLLTRRVRVCGRCRRELPPVVQHRGACARCATRLSLVVHSSAKYHAPGVQRLRSCVCTMKLTSQHGVSFISSIQLLTTWCHKDQNVLPPAKLFALH
eukprot:6460286-Amphidinium_carterae.1